MANGLSSPRSVTRLALVLLVGSGLCARAQSITVLKEVRFWSSVDLTRIAIETSRDVEFKHGLLQNPNRIFVDLVDVQPSGSFKGMAYTIPVEDGLVKKIRVAPNQASVTRVVLDLDSAVEVTTGKLVNPSRIVLDVRRVSGAPLVAPAPTVSQLPPAAPVPVPVAEAEVEVEPTPPPRPARPPTRLPARRAKVEPPPVIGPAPVLTVPIPAAKPPRIELAKATPPPKPAPPPPLVTVVKPFEPVTPPPPSTARRSAEAARMTTPSLTRALGLKLQRVVLDAGHGGIDPGSDGITGLVEKELALDITLRLGRLLEQRTDLEVLYTRKDDSYVALDDRAPFANRAKSDLFLSIHANTAPARSVLGTETYYLNRGESKEDLAVATRENAMAARSISELGDLVKKIVAYDKRDESREFAARIQSATHDLSTQTYGKLYNRGVRHSPLVVLIGATMPAVLVEVGFISNAREEALLKKADHRQKVAEALYKGITTYAQSLSHYSMASGQPAAARVRKPLSRPSE